MAELQTIGTGFHYEDLSLGQRFRTSARTITEADLVGFCNMTWLTEELFTNTRDRAHLAMPGRVVPGSLVYSYAEGLLLPMMQHTGLAFLEANLTMKGPTHVGDTIEVICEVIELRETSKPGRGLVRTRNEVMADDRCVLVYDPLRLLKRRGA